MRIIDLKIRDIKTLYKNQKPLQIENEKYAIGKVCGAISEFRLFRKGKQYLVLTDNKENDEDITFVILN
ncbi:hypothetical protein [Polaribacter sp.]|uniref:hypothetical protein n=1 Tax=Polaribacter sp. TaxID=1920175 RepID=UPI003F6DA367